MFSKIVDSEELLGTLPDCQKLTVDRIDLVTRTLRCRKIEIFDFEEDVSFTAEEEEAEPLSISTEEETSDEERTRGVVHDLDCLMRRIEFMQLKIKARKAQQMQQELDVASSSSIGVAVKRGVEAKIRSPLPAQAPEPLSVQEQLEVRDLQHGHHLLQCQIDELLCRYSILRRLLRQVHTQLGSLDHQLREQMVIVQEYLSWSQEAAQDKHVCLQRYHQLYRSKITSAEAQLVTHNHMANASMRSKKYLQNTLFRYELREFHDEIDELMQYAHDLRKEIEQRFDNIERQTTRHLKIEELKTRAKFKNGAQPKAKADEASKFSVI